ncbi:MAG: hypothetical protein ACJ8GN_01385 [Longimicrobiaceae bacterium]
MSFIVRKGVPEILELWKRLLKGYKQNTLDAEDRELFKKWSKAVAHLREDPFYPGLQSHEIDALTERVGRKVFQSYLENRTPAAGRLFWVYGPGPGEITVIGLEPHPEDRKSRGYDRVLLSDLPPLNDPPASSGQGKKPNPGKRR